MKKALLIIVAILAVAFFIGNAESVAEFGSTVVSGAPLPLFIALVVTVARYLTQAKSYDVGYNAVGFNSGYLHNLKLILSLVFINTFCLFSGATGLAFMIDDAHREGADGGQATSGSILTQIGFFAALFIIAVAGMVVMFATGQTNPVFIAGIGVLTITLVVLIGFYVVGYYLPNFLRKLMGFVNGIISKIAAFFKREFPNDWGETQANSFIDASRVLARNPSGVAITIAWATLSAVCHMSCMVAIGFAFGFPHVAPLVVAFSLAAVSIQLSPTPQGIGVTEAVVAFVLTGEGATMEQAAAIALVYRGIMLWLPFIVGAFFLSQMGFFKGKGGTKTEDMRRADTAWITGTLMLLLGLINIVLVLFNGALLPYAMLTQFVDLQGFAGGALFWVHIIGGLALMVLAIGLIKRLHTAWLASVIVIIALAAVELYLGVVQVAIALAVYSVWLVAQKRAFDKPDKLYRQWLIKHGARKQEFAVIELAAEEGEKNENEGSPMDP